MLDKVSKSKSINNYIMQFVAYEGRDDYANKRQKELGKLIVVGGPGGSGCSTIAKMLAKNFALNYIYAGNMMQKFAHQQGFVDFNQLLGSRESTKLLARADKFIDKETLKASFYPETLIDSKIFGALSSLKRIPTTVKIWLTCDIENRVSRTIISKKKIIVKGKLSKHSKLYKDTASELLKRYSVDKNRFKKIYGIDFDSPEKYYDIVIDSTKLNPSETYRLIITLLKDGKYIK